MRRGALGDTKGKLSQVSVFSLLQYWALISSLDLIKLVNVPSATIGVAGGPVDAQAALGLGSWDRPGDGSPLSQVGVTLVLNFKPALCRVGDPVVGGREGVEDATVIWGKLGEPPKGSGDPPPRASFWTSGF